ncbi:unnamed protein product [Parajaminaea phylloscopi]
MSATDQFPPRHLVADPQDGADPGSAVQGASSEGESRTGHRAPLALTDQPANEDKVRQLDASTGNKVALDELGPMVVNKDGTLSRIHNWESMTEAERARTIRVLGARNQLRMADLRSSGEDPAASTKTGAADVPSTGDA